jgi:hypothetical protein
MYKAQFSNFFRSKTMAEFETRIVWDEATTENWQNALHDDCITLIDNEVVIKFINVPYCVRRAIEQCTNNVNFNKA